MNDRVPFPDDGCCQACGAPAKPWPSVCFAGLYRDHDHGTGLHRGWLCRSYNNGLPYSEELRYYNGEPTRLRPELIAYLDAHLVSLVEGNR